MCINNETLQDLHIAVWSQYQQNKATRKRVSTPWCEFLKPWTINLQIQKISYPFEEETLTYTTHTHIYIYAHTHTNYCILPCLIIHDIKDFYLRKSLNFCLRSFFSFPLAHWELGKMYHILSNINQLNVIRDYQLLNP